MLYDAVIIGAGPAGAHLGYLLASAGATVALVDRAVFPRDKLCGGLLTKKTIMLLSSSYPNEIFNGFDIIQAHILYKGELLSSIKLLSSARTVCRYQFDATLVKFAVTQGADSYLGDSLLNIDTTSQMVYLKSGRGLRYKYLIGADGAMSKVRHLVGLPDGHIGFCMEAYVPWAQVKEKESLQAKGIKLFYGNYPTGYGWVFPNNEVVSIGVGNLSSTMPVKDIIRSFPQFINNIAYTESAKFRGAFIPSGSSVVLGTPNINNLFLIGDAAGLIDPLTGEGLYYALLSAETAASVLMSCNPSLSAYQFHMRDIITQIEDCVKIRNSIYKPAVLRGVLGAMQNMAQYGEKLIDETIIQYSKSYAVAYNELQQYMR